VLRRRRQVAVVRHRLALGLRVLAVVRVVARDTPSGVGRQA
jgi:hypothetical protein